MTMSNSVLFNQLSKALKAEPTARQELIDRVVEHLSHHPEDFVAELAEILLAFRSDHNEATRKQIVNCFERAVKREPAVIRWCHEAVLGWVTDRSPTIQRKAVLTLDAAYRWALGQAAGLAPSHSLGSLASTSFPQPEISAVWRSISFAKDRAVAMLDQSGTVDTGERGCYLYVASDLRRCCGDKTTTTSPLPCRWLNLKYPLFQTLYLQFDLRCFNCWKRRRTAPAPRYRRRRCRQLLRNTAVGCSTPRLLRFGEGLGVDRCNLFYRCLFHRMGLSRSC